MLSKVTPALFTAFVVVTLIRSPDVAGDFVETVGEILAAFVDQLREVLESLFA